MGDRGELWDQAGAAIPAQGSDPEQECWSPTAITLCSATGTLGIVTALQGCPCCPFLAILALDTTGAWHGVAPGPGILAPDTSRFRHPGTGHHRVLDHRASHCNRSQHPGEMELMLLCTSSRMGAEPGPVLRRQNSLQEPPPSLLKTPHPSLRSGAPPWPGCALQHRDSDAVNELEGL